MVFALYRMILALYCSDGHGFNDLVVQKHIGHDAGNDHNHNCYNCMVQLVEYCPLNLVRLTGRVVFD